VQVAILLPGFTTATKVSNAVTVAETVIVGTVPETYTYFSTDPADGGEDEKDYVLNQG
ncbi:MAG: sporulation protein YunB, partial [Oscillibacter sp.]|nr:sporulation protein YunB [Oscillibacter sp.]